jgi:molybdopterin-synthase adenylyltransferase
MSEFDLRIRESDWARLRKHCGPSFRGQKDTEIGAIGLLGRRMIGAKLRELIVTQVLWPEPGEVLAEPSSALTFTSRYLRRAHITVRKAGLAGLVTFHTHPLAGSEVGFSWYDDQQDPLLIENLQDLWPPTLLSSVVLGANSQSGRLWLSPKRQLAATRLIVIGESLQYLPLDGQKPKAAPTPSEIFDRATALTGSGALALLEGMTVAVIGASGTGSLVCELLARAGCRKILLIDHDIVKLANLNRILHAKKEDAAHRRRKVEVLKRGIEALGLGCEVMPVVGSILDNAVLQLLNEADFLIGCIDKDYPRMLLCKYAYQHNVPYIDVGAEIGGDQEGIVSTDARVNYVAPGRWCLRCTGLVSPRRLAFESLTGAERKRKIALGYSDDLLIKQPAVMDLNMRAASAGVMLLRHLLQPFLRTPLPVTLAENLVTFNMKPVAGARSRNEGCDICQANTRSGFGDCGEPIGLASDVAGALLDEQDETRGTAN